MDRPRGVSLLWCDLSHCLVVYDGGAFQDAESEYVSATAWTYASPSIAHDDALRAAQWHLCAATSASICAANDNVREIHVATMKTALETPFITPNRRVF